ncbi:HNH endonuclease [Vibrio parahaemolyticus]
MEKKITRICWNSNDWIAPSGMKGKSKDKSSFEVNPGYGHEEWIFDLSKLLSGFKYSFLQGVNTTKKKHQGYKYRISLFTVFEGRKLCVAHIDEVECLTRKQASEAVKAYSKNGWFKEMHSQLKAIGIESPKVVEDDPLFNFNIRFDPEKLSIYETPIDITNDYKSPRYKLFDKIREEGSTDPISSDIIKLMEGDLSDTEKQQLILSRVGQGKFRDNVVATWGEERCALTLINIREILVASHIRPWSKCLTKDQRLDGANGLLLCAHIDRLFDQHLLSFECKRGRYYLRLSKKLNKKQLSLLGVDSGTELATTSLSRNEITHFEEYILEHFKTFSQKNSEV